MNRYSRNKPLSAEALEPRRYRHLPVLLLTLTAETKERLCAVPQPPTDPQARWYYYNSPWWIYSFKQGLACRLKQVTDPFVPDDKRTPVNEKTLHLTLDGFTKQQLERISQEKDVIIGNDDAEIKSFTYASDLKSATVTFKPKNASTGAKRVTVGKRTMDGSVTSFDAVNFLGLISVVPDTTVAVGDEIPRIFKGDVLVGTCDPVELTAKLDGIHETIPCSFEQAKLNLTCVNVKSPTEANFFTTGGAVNGATFIAQSTETAGTTPVSLYAEETTTDMSDGVPPKTEAEYLVSAPPERNSKVDLLTDVDNKDGMTDADQGIEENPGAFICENDDDDNKSDVIDKNEVFIENEDDMKKVRITLEAIDAEGKVVLKRSNTNIRVWSDQEKDLFSDILTGNTEMEETLDLSKFTVANGIYTMNIWVEGYTPGESILTLEYKGGGQMADDKIKFTVLEMKKVPLGGSVDAIAGQGCFKVYVPTRWGGRLTISTTSGTTGKIRKPGGDSFVNGNETGQDNHGWYTFDIISSSNYTVTTSFEQTGKSSRRPWNFYWYTFRDNSDVSDLPKMWEDDGPLDKYDRAFNKTAREWELDTANGHRGSDLERWTGHCWGAIIASNFIPQPKSATVNGVDFTEENTEALYTEYFTNLGVEADGYMVDVPPGPPTDATGEDVDGYADNFHNGLIQCLRVRKRPAASNMRDETGANSEEVWNHLIFKYTSIFKEEEGTDDEKRIEVSTKTFATTDHEPPTPDTDERTDEYVYRLAFKLDGEIEEDASSQNWISSSAFVPKSLRRFKKEPIGPGDNLHIDKSLLDDNFR